MVATVVEADFDDELAHFFAFFASAFLAFSSFLPFTSAFAASRSNAIGRSADTFRTFFEGYLHGA